MNKIVPDWREGVVEELRGRDKKGEIEEKEC